LRSASRVVTRRRKSKRAAAAAAAAAAAPAVKKRGSPGRGGRCRAAAVRRNGFELLDQDCRVRVLEFLEPDDLAEAAMACRQLRDDCRHESLPRGPRTAVIRIPPKCPRRHRVGRIGACLIRMAAVTLPDGRRKFHNFPRLRIVDPHRKVPNTKFLWPSPRPTIEEITALDWSGREEPGSDCPERYLRDERSQIAMVLPNLREVDFSHAFSQDCLRYPSTMRYSLEKVTWHGHRFRVQVDGRQLGRCRSLREVHMDGSCFEAPDDEPRLFVQVRDRLERVSVRGARWMPPSGRPSRKVTQVMLIDFVRNAPNLRWFRSDLSPRNVARLRRERPDVTFVS
jgi:hypothetical protein